MTEIILAEDVIKEFDESKFRLLTHTRVSENKQIEKKVYRHLHDICLSCGLVEWLKFDEEKFIYTYELKLIESACQTEDIHNSIFKKLVLDTINGKKRIFAITDEQLFINRKLTMFPMLTLKYDSFEAMLLDMISAANYIKENLDAGKNRNN